MQDIGKINYRSDLNRTYVGLHKRAKFFYESRMNVETIRKCLDTLFEEITSTDQGCDLHLQAFLSTPTEIQIFSEYAPDRLSIVLYPLKGEIAGYKLKKGELFFSNAQADPYPLIIGGIKKKIYVDSKSNRDEIWVAGYNGPLPNVITGCILFKRDPFEDLERYPGMKEFLEEQSN